MTDPDPVRLPLYQADLAHPFLAADGSMMCEQHPGQAWGQCAGGVDCPGPGTAWTLRGRTLIEEVLAGRLPVGRPPEFSWFNDICAALGLFDGARPVSPAHVLWTEVLPTIEALKTNNPEAGVLVREQERVYGLWRDALAKMAEANRRADGFLERWHEVEADRNLLRNALKDMEAPFRPRFDVEIRAEALWEELGGDLCICQRADVLHWCEKCQQRIALISRALSRVLQGRDAWQPIETAPKDGTWLLLARKQVMSGQLIVVSGSWNSGGAMHMPHWMSAVLGFQPTHWMPMPPLLAPPASADETRHDL